MSKDYEKLSKQHFDEHAKDYDETNTIYYSKYPKISCNNVADYMKDKKFKSLLDVGCGTGYLIDMLYKQHKANYCGLDLSPEMILAADKKLGEKAKLTEGSADNLPYPDNSFDVVTCIQSFHHYPYPEKAMNEVLRVLKPNGIYILSDTGYGGLKQKFFKKMMTRMDSGDYTVYNIKEIVEMMSKAGLKPVSANKIAYMIYTVIGRK